MHKIRRIFLVLAFFISLQLKAQNVSNSQLWTDFLVGWLTKCNKNPNSPRIDFSYQQAIVT